MEQTYMPGTCIGPWLVEQPLGKGGMGSVYRCRNADAGRIKSAIKLLNSSYKSNPEATARLLREAEILYTIEHPNVVSVSNVHLDASPPYIQMEFIDGMSLESELANIGPMPVNVTITRMRALADAVAYLHRKKIFHRDLKPDNLLIRSNDGVIKIVDFGLAVEIGGDRITQQGQTQFGTVSYCPPEWMHPGELDPAVWDCYALGVIFYEMLTGQVAFPLPKASDYRRQMVLVMTDKQGVAHLDPGPRFHPELRKLVRDMTARDVVDRLTSARDVSRRLETIDPLEHFEPEAPPPSPLATDPPTVNLEPSPTTGFQPSSTLAFGMFAVGLVSLLLAGGIVLANFIL